VNNTAIKFPSFSQKQFPEITQTSTRGVGFMRFNTEKYLEALIPLQARNPDQIFDIHLTGDNGFMGINNHSYHCVPPEGKPFQPNPYPNLIHYGQRIHIRIFNNNKDTHAMHLHGHKFQVIELNGQPVSGALRDVVLMPGGCTSAIVAFDAINPGVWLFHCHMEFHMAAGMITTFEYV